MLKGITLILKYDLTIKQLSIEDLVDCFRGWVQKVQLLSMDNSKLEETKKIAQMTLEDMVGYTTEFEEFFDIAILNEKVGIGH